MHAHNLGRWAVLAAVLTMAAEAQADVITPDSIAHPPGAVGSANGTLVFANNLVTGQYAALGLNFTSGAAITNLNGVNVWAPTESLLQPLFRTLPGGPPPFPAARISYNGTWGGASFVQPGTQTPTSVSSLTLEILGRPVTVDLFNEQGQLMGTASLGGMGLHGGQLYTFTGSGISSFSVLAPAIVPPPGAMAINPAWGVAEVSFTPAHAPEPSSLILAGLGALGLAARFGWRRVRLAA
ncbi:MAG TPA: PEP-CTERM sorting domain-containing protein [Gemmataceae bacterium]|jgi:hypothetical protein